MNDEQLASIKKIFLVLSAYYREQLPDMVIQMYASDLSDLDFFEVKAALEAYRKNPKNRRVPMPAEIRNMISPVLSDDSMAREIAVRIQGAIVRFGYTGGAEAKEFIGEIGWSIVMSYGGWRYVCENLGKSIDVNTFQAQARELAKTRVTFGEESIAKQLLGTQTPKLLNTRITENELELRRQKLLGQARGDKCNTSD